MTTGFRSDIEDGHDVIYDYCCTTCAHENLNAEGLYYCKDCSQLFCKPCKKYHDKFFKTHQVFGRKELDKWGDVRPLTLSLMCGEHPGKELALFCEDHDRLCCAICISVKHRGCRKILPVSEVSKGIQRQSDFTTLLTKAANTQSKLETLHNKQEDHIKMLQNARGEITSTFKNMRKKLNQIVDRLEEDSTTELDRLLTTLNERVTTDQEACSDLLKKIKKLLGDIQTLGKQCDELAFQGYKICSEHISSADKLLSSMQNVDYQIKFIPDFKIEQYLSSLETLGSFHVTPSGGAYNTGMKIDDGVQTLSPPDHVFSVVDKQTYNVKTSGDTETCYISGICLLPNGQVVIVDQYNSKVKMLNSSTYSTLDDLELLPYPQDICHTTGTELAITLCEKKGVRYIRKEIQFINAGNGKLSYSRTVQLDHECTGIAFFDAQLYVGASDALYVYSLLGKKIEKIYEDTSSENSTISRVSLNDDGSRIYVTNMHRNLLITLNNSGQLLRTFSDSELQWPKGVCVADNGSVFVCGCNSHTVLQVNRKGKTKITTLTTKDDGVFVPEILCYDRRTQTLLVGKNSDNLVVLQLK